VALMVLFGADLVRASRTGPRWKRAMVTASLAVLTAIGLNVAARDVSARQPPPLRPPQRPRPSCYLMVHRPDNPLNGAALPARMAAIKKLGVMEKVKSDVLKKLAAQVRAEIGPYEKVVVSRLPADSTERTKARKTLSDARIWLTAADIRLAVGDKPLGDAPVWRDLMKNWRQAAEAASGRKGRYPFDSKTKKALLSALDAAPVQLDALAVAGYLTAPEAGLLKNALEPLPARVKRMRPTEFRNATCYRPMSIAKQDPLLKMLARMPLIEKVTQSRKLHPAAAKKIVAILETQIAELTEQKYLKGLTANSRVTAGNVVKAARAAMKKLTAASTPSPTPAVEPAGSARPADDSKTSPALAVFDLEAQLKKLAGLTSARDFNGPAISHTIKSVNASVAILSDPANIAQLTPKGEDRAKTLLSDAKKQIAIARALIPIGTTNLARSDHWRIVSDAWRYSVPLADSYKSTTAQRKIVTKKLKDADAAISALSAAGLLSASEAAMLVIDMNRIKSDLLRDPPTDAQFTCYDYGFLPAVQLSMNNLSKRVELLRKVVASDRVAPAAMDRIVQRVQRELDQLEDPTLARGLRNKADRLKAKKLHAEVSALVVRIKCNVLGMRLGETSGWKTVETALAAAAPLAATRRSTSAQRVAVVKQMDIAKSNLTSLTEAGLLAAVETELLFGELARLKNAIFRDPPTDTKVSCYEMMAPDPVGDSTKRLIKRIPMLSKLIDSGKLNPLVAGKLLGSISADIKMLKNAKKAEPLRKQAIALLTRIDRHFSGGPK
jgi:hypothetical protein